MVGGGYADPAAGECSTTRQIEQTGPHWCMESGGRGGRGGRGGTISARSSIIDNEPRLVHISYYQVLEEARSAQIQPLNAYAHHTRPSYMP
jgi:hypothetical protein